MPKICGPGPRAGPARAKGLVKSGRRPEYVNNELLLRVREQPERNLCCGTMAGFMPRWRRQRIKTKSNKNSNQSHVAIPICMQAKLGYMNGETALLLLVDECG